MRKPPHSLRAPRAPGRRAVSRRLRPPLILAGQVAPTAAARSMATLAQRPPSGPAQPAAGGALVARLHPASAEATRGTARLVFGPARRPVRVSVSVRRLRPGETP